ncbi:MAG: M20/M25/M40 family metallo-hydrolase, partial [Dehalococcoidia bacterium]
SRSLVLTAHTDHPGFVVSAVRGRRLTLEFRGGLSAQYGVGERVRLFGDGTAAARVTAVRAPPPARRGAARRIAGATATLEPGGSAAAGDLALWDVEPFRLRGTTIHARACDDLAGCVAVLATLNRAAASGAPGHLVGLFTRAEEVGLLGAAAAHGGHIPERAIVIAVETSSMAGGRAVQGGGPIVRVGDAQHIFSSSVSLWMTALAAQLVEEGGGFAYQRKLMDGGTTEATAFDLMGHETGAACIALGNYHNAGPRGRVRAETVDLGDLEGLVRLFERMHRELPRYERTLADARRRWERIGRDALRELAGG